MTLPAIGLASGRRPHCALTILATCALITAPAEAALLINEVFVDPDGPDDNREYIELLSTTGDDPLEEVALLEIESDSESLRGNIDRIVRLDGASYDAHGLLVLIDDEPTPNPYGLSGPHVVDLNSTPIEQDATFLLVQGFEGIVGDAVDEDHDGVIDNQPWTTLLDAVTLNRLAKGHADYAGAAPQTTDGERAPDALVRFPGADDTVSAAAWYGGVIASGSDEGATDQTFRTDEGLLTSNFPAGGMLTPGAPNVADADVPNGDLNGDGTVSAADYTAWRDGLGAGFSMDDYLAWRDAYGGVPAPGAATPVPEPASALLTLLALARCGVRAGRRR